MADKKFNIVQDSIDTRDYIYRPALRPLGRSYINPAIRFGFLERPSNGAGAPAMPPLVAVRDQKERETCIGEALASVIDIHLLEALAEDKNSPPPDAFDRVSSAMLYAMAATIEAREKDDKGLLSLRSALKGFYNCGVCAEKLWEPEWGLSFDSISPDAASDARRISLGAYYRVLNVLNDYHAALHEAGSILASATIHDGWMDASGGEIVFRPGGSVRGHAFTVVGYTDKGFLVLNSFGPDWGGYVLDGVRLPGVALWRYDDWAGSVRDSWVVRLGVSTPDSFRFTVGSFGRSSERNAEAGSAAAPALSAPRRMSVVGRYLTFENGGYAKTGPYPTSAQSLKTTIDILTQRSENTPGNPYYGDVVIAFHGTPEDPGDALARLEKQIAADKADGIYRISIIWANEVMSGTITALTPLFAQALQRAGRPGPDCDALVEQMTSPVGRAVWRDIKQRARDLVEDMPSGDKSDLMSAILAIVDCCNETGRRLHLVTEAAGVFALKQVVDWLPFMPRERRALLNVLRTIHCVAPTITSESFAKTFRRLLDDWEQQYPRAEIMLLNPSDVFENSLEVYPYTKSWSRLIKAAFEDEPGPLVSLTETPPPFASDRLRRVSLDLPKGAPATLSSIFTHPTVDAHLRMAIRTSATAQSPATASNLTEYSPDVFVSAQELERGAADLSVSRETLASYFTHSEDVETAFTAPIVPKPGVKNVRVARGEIAVPFANKLSRIRRQAEFRFRVAMGYDGPIIVSEGDSWFQYPFLLEDVIDWLSQDYAIFSLDAAGDTLAGMLNQAELAEAVARWKPSIVLLSGGGNDALAEGRIAEVVHRYDPAKNAAAHLKPEFDNLVGGAIERYRQLIASVTAAHASARIICHGYDYVVPNSGIWLGKPMAELQIPLAIQKAIAKEMISRFNEKLAALSDGDAVTVLNNLGTVGAGQWSDELHPVDAGYKKIAEKFRTVIERLAPQSRAGRGAPKSALKKTVSKSTNHPVGYSLHIGVNKLGKGYFGELAPLTGCINDAKRLKALARQLGYQPETLFDKAATRRAVADRIVDIASQMRPGDIFLMSYSGHGSQATDADGDEGAGRYDSTWCLHDGEMIDDEFIALWARFPAGARVVMISDSCHSGSVISAPRVNVVDSKVVARRLPVEAEIHVNQNRSFAKREPLFLTGEGAAAPAPPRSAIKASITLLAAAQDDQSAFEAKIGDSVGGYFTNSLVEAFAETFSGNHGQLIDRIVGELDMQRPNLFQLGATDTAFGAQQALAINGVAAATAIGRKKKKLPSAIMARGIPNAQNRPYKFDPQTGALLLDEMNGLAADIKGLVIAQRAWIETVAKATCRIVMNEELLGSGWLVAPNLVMTARHVASRFALGSDWAKDGDPLFLFDGEKRTLDGRTPIHEGGSDRTDRDLNLRRLDAVVLRLNTPVGIAVPKLCLTAPQPNTVVGVIGFPAVATAQVAVADALFGAGYDKFKWFSPGRVIDGESDNVFGQPQAQDRRSWFAKHDSSVLPGNSGSVVLDLAAGNVVGIHFATVPADRPTANIFHTISGIARHRVAMIEAIKHANPDPVPIV